MDSRILDNHTELSPASRDFLNYMVKEQRCLSKLDLLSNDLPVFVREFEYPFQSWPLFISKQIVADFESCASTILNVIDKAIRHEFNGAAKKLAEFYSVPELYAELITGDRLALREVPIRIDALLGPTGLKILEVNVGSQIGGWQIRWVSEQYRKLPELATFFKRINCVSQDLVSEYFDYLISLSTDKYSADSAPINVLIVPNPASKLLQSKQSFQNIYTSVLDNKQLIGSLEIEPCYDDLEFRSEGVFLNGKKLSAIMTSAPGLDGALGFRLFAAHLAGQIFWVDNPLFDVLGEKRSLALVHKHKNSDIYTDHEMQCIDRFIPWCAPSSPQSILYKGTEFSLEQLLLSQQESFVIKHGAGYEGRDVYIGKYTASDVWNDVLQRALKDGKWLVQEYCESNRYYAQSDNSYTSFDIIWGLFVFGDKYAGNVLRFMKSDSGTGVVNAATGAESGIAYEVD